MKTTPLLIPILLPFTLEAATVTWTPTATATYNPASSGTDGRYADANNWDGGVVPGASDSIYIDANNAYNDGVTFNTGGSGEFGVTIHTSQTLASGQSITTGGSNAAAVYTDLTIRNGGVLDVYGTIDLSGANGAGGSRLLTAGTGLYRIHSGSSLTSTYAIVNAEYVINSVNDVFDFTTVSNAHFEFGNSIGFDLSGLTDDLDGESFTIFSGTLPGTYDDANTYVTGSSAYAASITQSGTGANQTLTVNFTAIPEPTSLTLLGLGAFTLISRRKR